MYNPDNLWEALSNNNLQEVQKILSSGSNIDLNKPFGITVGYDEKEWSSRYYEGFITTRKYRTEKSGNYLLQACLFSSPVVVSALVKAGANVNKSSDVMCKSTSKYYGSDVYERQYNATPLIFAVVQRNVELVKKLLHRCGADVNARNNEGLTALHLTVKPPSTSFEYNKINCLSLRTESATQREQIFSLLVAAGANVNLKDSKGRTPLHIAAKEKDAVVARMLLQHHARVDTPNREGTPLYIAAMEKDTVVARMLVQHHARVDIPNTEGMTPLHVAARALDAEMCSILTDETGVDGSTIVNVVANDGTTPLHAAIHSMAGMWHRKHIAAAATCIVNLFITKGADLTAKQHHLTALHLAAEHGLIDIVKLLVEAGADIHAETPNTGLTPLDMAEHRNNQEVIDYLTARQESDTCEREKNKREEPSVEKDEEEEEDESEQSDTPVEESLEGAVGGFDQVLVIKDEGKHLEE